MSSQSSWRQLARQRDVDASQLTRRHRAALDWLGTARFLLFRDPARWSLRDLLLSNGDPRVRVRLEGEADAICDVFDQTSRARFDPHMPIRLPVTDGRRLSDHHKDLLGWAARSLQGPRSLYLSVQAATGKASTVDLTPHLDGMPSRASQHTLAEDAGHLRDAIASFEQLARRRLTEVRESRRP